MLSIVGHNPSQAPNSLVFAEEYLALTRKNAGVWFHSGMNMDTCLLSTPALVDILNILELQHILSKWRAWSPYLRGHGLHDRFTV